MSSTITVSLVTPERILLEDDVNEVQAPAFDGYMGFLPRHAPYVSTLGIGILTLKKKDEPDILFSISGGGYFEIHQNQMIILADVAENVTEIDIERAEQSRKRALKRILGQEPGSWDLDRAKASLYRANNRIRVRSFVKVDNG